jgi:hypothetical protein
MKLKVKGHNDLVRDTNSNAIVNNNKVAYINYMSRQKKIQIERDTLSNTIKEINSLKQELFEIKSLIKEVIKKDGK